ncbi:unnamed protein product [Effrenium voratum]|uniref:Uncharacterized protein n=1 Tax=Effrenium voratum TaxID=2562239 RepID=A0AA36MJB4_9DINO|nr:unnamed protein product [Effrenium voratum]
MASDLEEDKIWITDHEVQKGMSAQNVRELKVKTVKKGTVLTQKAFAAGSAGIGHLSAFGGSLEAPVALCGTLSKVSLGEHDNVVYKGASSGKKEQLQASLADPSNWEPTRARMLTAFSIASDDDNTTTSMDMTMTTTFMQNHTATETTMTTMYPSTTPMMTTMETTMGTTMMGTTMGTTMEMTTSRNTVSSARAACAGALAFLGLVL